MTVDRLINILVTIILIQMMVSIGRSVTLPNTIDVVRNLGLLLHAALANYICIPAVAIGLLLWFHSPPIVAAGFLIVALYPGAPYGPPFTALAKEQTRKPLVMAAPLPSRSEHILEKTRS